MTRSGRRPGDSGTRSAVLAAARHRFGTAGYSGTTIRGIARDAGVDPALVHRFFGTKEQLFTAALELPVDLSTLVPSLLAGGADGLGERVAATFLRTWDATPGQGPMLAMLRSAVSDPAAAASFRDFATTVVLAPLATAAGSDRPELRASLAASQLLGLAVARYVVRLEPLASVPAEVLARDVGPLIDHCLRGELG